MLDVLFVVSVDRPALKYEANGTMLLATKLLQAGISAEVIRFYQVDSYKAKNYPRFIKDMTERIIEKKPKCVSFYTLWPYYHIMLRLAAEIKEREPGILIVLGGPQASATARETLLAMPQIDYICAGEGENIVTQFFKEVLQGDGTKLSEIPSLWYRVEGEITFNNIDHPLCDLNTLPYWDEKLYIDVLEKEDFGGDSYFMPIDAGRGCPYSCTFCCTSYFWKRTFRLKSPDRILNDIKYYYNKFGIHSFWFSHDAFTASQRLVSEVCDRIIEEKLNIRWSCTTRIDCISKDLILKMKQAGLVSIALGVESGSKRMQKIINKRLDLAIVRDMTEFLLQNGLNVELFFMYGFPEETEEDLNQTLELFFDLIDKGAYHETVAMCRFNPLTTITEQYFDELILDPNINILFRGLLGVDEEMDMIRDNKALFTYYYHLPTKVRNAYQYTLIFARFYQECKLTMHYMRELYNGDNLKFYQDFYESNYKMFQMDISSAIKEMAASMQEVIEGVIDRLDSSYKSILCALLTYELDVKRVYNSKEDIVINRTYDFNYMDILRKKPLEKFTIAKTTIEMKKKGGKFSSQVLDIQ